VKARAGAGPSSIQELIFGYHANSAEWVSMRTAPLVALFVVDGLLVGVLSACSPTAMAPVTVFVDPGKYQYYNCEQPRWSADALDEPRAGIEAADGQGRAGHGGTVVNVIAYQTDYVTAREELKVSETTARAKNCDAPRRP